MGKAIRIVPLRVLIFLVLLIFSLGLVYGAIPTDPAYYWNFDGDCDEAGNYNDANCFNVTFSPINATGSGQSIYFDADETVTFEDAAIHASYSGNITYVAMIRFTSTARQNVFWNFAKNTHGFVKMSSGGNSFTRAYIQTTELTTTPGTSYSADTWYCIALRYNGTGVSHFVDGNKIGEKNGAGTVNHNAWYYGNADGDVQWFRGYIDEQTIWNRSLSETELVDLCGNDGVPSTPAPATNPNIAMENFQTNQSTVVTNQDVQWSVDLNSSFNLDYSIFEHNKSGSFFNTSPVKLVGTSLTVTYNLTIDLPIGSNVCGRFYANNTNTTMNNTGLECIFVNNSVPEITIVGPANNSASNSTLNATFIPFHPDGTNMNCSLYVDGLLNETNTSINNGERTILNANVGINGQYEWFINCTDATTYTLSNTFIWFYDNFFPTLTLNSNNAFNKESYALDNQYDDALFLNITIVDNRDLFAFLANITIDGTEYFSYQNESLSGLTFNFSQLVNTSTWPKDKTSLINFRAADSHTKNTIKDYQITESLRSLVFNTAEGNVITINSFRDANWEVEKKKDRYSITFAPYTTDAEGKYKFQIYCDNGFEYIEHSEFQGHMVCLNSNFDGNWLDFETTDGTPVDVSDEGNGWYEIEIEFEGDNITFNSIGGLNILNVNFTYYLGQYFLISPDSFERLPTYLILNVSFDNITQSDIDAALSYPYNTTTSQTKSIEKGYILFTDIFSAFQTGRGTTNVTEFNWTIDVTQKDGNKTEINQTGNHTNYGWDMDDCTTYTDWLMNYTVIDEKTENVVLFNASFVHSFWVTGYSTFKRNYDIIKSDSATNYSFCKFPSNVNFSGDMNHLISAAGYESKDYRIFNTAFTGVKTIYLLATEASNAYITYIITDSSLEKVEGAVMKFYRNIGGISTLVYEATTDFAGSVTAYQDQQNTYDITINATGFPFKSFFLRPISTLYTIQLDSEILPFYTNPYEGIRYKLTPASYIWNATNDYSTLKFEIEGNDLEYAGIKFEKYSPNMVCIPANCQNETTNINGGIMTIRFNSSQEERFLIKVYFKRSGKDVIYINDDSAFRGTFQDFSSNLYNVFKKLADETSPNVRIILVAITAFAMVAFFAQLGLVGMFAAPGVIVILWFFSIVGCRIPSGISALNPSYYFTGCDFYFIHPTVTIFTTVILVAAYVLFMQRRA